MNRLTTRLLSNRLTRSVTLAGLAAVLTLGIAAGPVAAASGSVGAHSRAQVTCDALSAKLLVHLPMVASVPVNTGSLFTVGGWTGGGTHPQLVGVRAWLTRWDATNGRWAYTDQNRDGYYDASPLLQITVLSDGTLFDSNWWNAEARRPIAAGDTLFGIRTTGHYKVFVEYFWHADRYVGSGYDFLESFDHYYTQWFTGSKPHCTY